MLIDAGESLCNNKNQIISESLSKFRIRFEVDELNWLFVGET